MAFDFRIISLIIFVLLFNACAHKELEQTKKELSQVRKKNTSIKAQLTTIQKKCEADLDNYQDSIGQIQLKIEELIRASPVQLMESNDSLIRILNIAEAEILKSQTDKQLIADSLASLKQEIKQLFHLEGSYSQRIKAPEGTYDSYIINTKHSNIKLYWKDATNTPIRSLNRLHKYTSEQCDNLLFATNGGMYKSDNSPQGLFIQEGKELIPIDLRKEEFGNFYMQPNGIFLLDTNNTAQIIVSDEFNEVLAKQTKFATQSGPMAVINGQINKKFNPTSKNKYIRSGVGKINDSTIVFLISNQPVRFYDFAKVFRDQFQCKNALYLDGAISKMYLPALGRFEKGGNFGPIIGITK